MHMADRVICISNFIQQERKIFGKNVIVIEDGIDIAKYQIEKNGRFCAGNKIELLFAGNMNESKGAMDAVKAVYILKNKYGYDNIHLTLAGSGDKYFNAIKKYIVVHDLQGCVECVGFQHDLVPYREKADIALMCSRNEGLGRVTVESMLSELLVIGAKAGATKDVITEGETGYFYEPGNVEQLASVICKTITNKSESIEVIKKAKKIAVQLYDDDKYAEKLAALYLSVINKRKIVKIKVE